MHCLADVLSFIEHGIDLVYDGGDDFVFPCELIGRAGGGVAFGDGQGAGSDVGRFFAFSNAFAESSVPTVARKASDHQITETTKAGEGVSLSAARDAKPAHLDDGPGHEGGFGVVAEAEAVAHTGSDGDHVFQRAAEFD